MHKAPKAPAEDPSVVVLRQRQIIDQAQQDEELNRRIKAGLMASRGVRAFRRSVSTRASGATPGRSSAGGGTAGGQRAFVIPPWDAAVRSGY